MGNKDLESDYLRLYSKHSQRLFEFISTMVYDRADADEVFQNTCVVLWKKFANYDPQGSFYAWACKIAYLEMLHLRRTNKRLQIFSIEVLELLAESMIGRADQLDSRQAALEECLGRLNTSDRQLIEQRYYRQLKPKELSRAKGKSIHSIYRALTRIHLALRNCVGQELAKESAR